MKSVSFFLLSPIGHSNQNSLIPPEGMTGFGRGATEDVPLECGQFKSVKSGLRA
jgi:hypothetical protein